MIAGQVLMVLSILWLVITAGLAIWDFAASFILHINTISGKIQEFIRAHPVWSILEFAATGFVIGLSIHFQLATIRFWLVSTISTILGAIIGFIVYMIRRPGEVV